MCSSDLGVVALADRAQLVAAIGDRLDTDIAGAAALGWDSCLVLTGVTSRADLADGAFTPTYVEEDLRALVRDQA